jgi:hypothetical protein
MSRKTRPFAAVRTAFAREHPVEAAELLALLSATKVSTFVLWFTTEIASSPEALSASSTPTAPG